MLVGGAFFIRVILLKYANREGGLADALKDTVLKRWLHLSGSLLVVMLVTGLFNFTHKNEAWKAAEGAVSPHMIFGIKFLVYLGVVVLVAVSAVATRKRPALLAANVILGIVIIFMSAWLSLSY